MRIHVYEEDLGLPAQVEIVRTVAGTGLPFVGLRVWLEGSSRLHREEGDDDRSAVTVWAADGEAGWLLLEDLCHRMMLAVLEGKEQARG